DALEAAPGYASLSLVVAKDADSPMTTAEMTTSTGAQAPVAAAPLRTLVPRRTPRDRLIGVQYILSSMGYLTPQNFDGTFGKATATAIKAFGKTNGLRENGAFNDELVNKVHEVGGRAVPPEGHLFV